MESKDFVSVIIPNFNHAIHLQQCLEALTLQTYPKINYEIIVVDNGSTDNSIAIAKQFSVRVIQYTQQKNPYPCRNIGIKNARGNIIALTDSKCKPDFHWLENGVKALSKKKEAAVIGGNIICKLDQSSSLSEIVYALIYLNIAPTPSQTAAALTGNLFTRKKTFEEIGYYLESNLSGADVEWTERAKSKKLKVIYDAQTIVSYPPKCWKDLMEAAYRDGKAEADLFAKKQGIFSYLGQAIYHARPPYLSSIRKKISRKNIPIFDRSIWSIWWVYWLVRIQWSRGMLGL